MIFYFSLIEILPNFVEAFILDWLLQTVTYPLCFKRGIGTLTVFIFKVELPTNGLQDVSFLVTKSIQTRKHCCEASGPSPVI